ncbi:MAG TPA: ATP-binding protein [Povalibacter sp.]
MSQPATQQWIEANQRYLAAQFLRLKARLGDEAHQQDATALCETACTELPAPAACDVVADAFGLSRFERDLLLLCAGVEMDAQIAQRCAQIQGSSQRSYATFSLGLSILDEPHWSALAPVSPLRRWRIVEVDDSAGVASARLRIDERILHYLAGVNYLDTRLRCLFRSSRPNSPMGRAQMETSANIVSAARETPTCPPVVVLTGDDLLGQADVASQVASQMGLHLHVLSAEHIPATAAEIAALATLWQREALLLGSALLIECDDRAMHRQTASLVDQLSCLVFIAGREAFGTNRAMLSAAVNKPEAMDQRVLWEQALGSAVGRMNGSLNGVASQFRLSASTIAATGTALRAPLATSDRPDALLWQACRSASRCKLDELAQRIEAAADWEMLILPPAQKSTLRLITAHVRHRLAVYHDWGFADRSARGLGITVLFAGESGTGKTLAAEILAKELQLDLYRIDLSAVVSKYIGETEKNLRRVFDAAEESGAILLFDEADALFGKRSEVKDSHDRFANIEVSYLLQRMECYRGLAVLTTNMKSALDPAFRRRLRFVVQFPFPDATQREAIWRSVFPPATPTHALDFAKLAKLQVAGGNVRNIALNAAFLAAAAHEPVRMSHLLEAAHSEGAKREQPLSDAETKGWV